MLATIVQSTSSSDGGSAADVDGIAISFTAKLRSARYAIQEFAAERGRSKDNEVSP